MIPNNDKEIKEIIENNDDLKLLVGKSHLLTLISIPLVLILITITIFIKPNIVIEKQSKVNEEKTTLEIIKNK